MPELNSTNQVREWLNSCPAISKANRFRIDYLAENATEYALYSVPSPLVYKENVLGEYVLNDDQTLNFIFASREAYGADIQQNLENLAFYEEVIAWIIEQNNLHSFPLISEGRVRSIVPTLTPFVVDGGTDAARYQIQIRMTYRLIK